MYLSRMKDDADLKKPMNEGNRFLGMHNWKDTLNDEQIRDLILYIRSVAPQVKVKPYTSEGGKEPSETPISGAGRVHAQAGDDPERHGQTSPFGACQLSEHLMIKTVAKPLVARFLETRTEEFVKGTDRGAIFVKESPLAEGPKGSELFPKRTLRSG